MRPRCRELNTWCGVLGDGNHVGMQMKHNIENMVYASVYVT